MHLANVVRYDMSYAVHYLARFMHKPSSNLWTAGEHILRYLKGTESLGILCQWEDENKELKTYSDADRGLKKPNRKYISGYLFLNSDGAVSWRPKQQSIVAQSSKEATYIVLASCIKEVLWIQKFRLILQIYYKVMKSTRCLGYN